MYTVEYKENDAWLTADVQFPTVDHAKRYTVTEGYGEYKVWNGGDQLCHLFNAVKTKAKKAKKEKITLVSNLVPKEPIMDDEYDKED